MQRRGLILPICACYNPVVSLVVFASIRSSESDNLETDVELIVNGSCKTSE